MSTRSLLVSFAGYPSALNSLLPDNGLAILAGSLVEAGHSATVLDYSTVSLIRRMCPPRYSAPLSRTARRMMQRITEGRKPRATDIASLLVLEKLLEAHHRRVFAEIGREISERVARDKIDFVCFKLWNGDGFSGSLRIARDLKRDHPALPIFAGGPHADMFGGHIYTATSRLDAIACAEGEETVVRLAEHVQGKLKLEDVPNLIFKREGEIVTTPVRRTEDLNDLPLPLYDEDTYPAMAGDEKIKMIIVDESRGCNNSCAFCPHPMKSGRLRVKSPARAVRELRRIRDEYGIRAFRYAGSNTPISHLAEIAREMTAGNLGMDYSCFAHVRGAEKEHLQALKDSGCQAVFFGIESGSDRILRDCMHKGVDSEQIRKAVLYAKQAGLFTVGSIIFPAPLQTEQDTRATRDLLLEVRPDSVPMQIPMLCPGTLWKKNPERYGFEVNTQAYDREAMGYKVKLLSPPRFWKPMPYRINGKGFKAYVGEFEQFAKLLEGEGLLTGFTDDMALMARYADLTPRELRDANRLQFLTGDCEGVGELVRKINRCSAPGVSSEHS